MQVKIHTHWVEFIWIHDCISPPPAAHHYKWLYLISNPDAAAAASQVLICCCCFQLFLMLLQQILTSSFYAARVTSELQAGHQGSLSDMVCFYLGCSFGFEGRLKSAGVPVRNVEQGKNVSMYRVWCRKSCVETITWFDYRYLKWIVAPQHTKICIIFQESQSNDAS